MDTEQQKFEKTREKFRRNMEAQQAKTRRTIFLTDDDIPSTSNQSYRRKQKQHKSRVEQGSQRHQPDRNTTQGCSKTARLFQMNCDTPPPPSLYKPPAAPKRPDHQTAGTTLPPSPRDEVPPPPPPLTETQPTKEESNLQSYSEETRKMGTPPPPIWEDDCFTLDDLDIDPEDLRDPLILEFCRTFWGMNDTTIDIRPPAPPSPPSSFSSIDWENENFHPPTPPRRKGYGSLDIQDSQYEYFGMHCYERVWRARLLVPRGRPVSALLQSASSLTGGRQLTATSTGPVTTNYGQISPTPPDIVLRQTMPSRHSPVPPPPPIPKMIVVANPLLEQLPPEIQQELIKRRDNHKGKRLRFKQMIWQREYRVNITPSGHIRITLVQGGEQCDG